MADRCAARRSTASAIAPTPPSKRRSKRHHVRRHAGPGLRQIKKFYDHVGGFGHLLIMGQAGFLEHDETVLGIRTFARNVYPRLKGDAGYGDFRHARRARGGLNRGVQPLPPRRKIATIPANAAARFADSGAGEWMALARVLTTAMIGFFALAAPQGQTITLPIISRSSSASRPDRRRTLSRVISAHELASASASPSSSRTSPAPAASSPRRRWRGRAGWLHDHGRAGGTLAINPSLSRACPTIR